MRMYERTFEGDSSGAIVSSRHSDSHGRANKGLTEDLKGLLYRWRKTDRQP